MIKTISDLNEIPSGLVLTIGNFDGVHLGHRKILHVARQLADKYKTSVAMMTFDPHPLAILHPGKAPGTLTPLLLKKQLLAELGVDYRLVLNSGADIFSLSPRQFVEKFIVDSINPVAVVEGNDFSFGARRTGNVEILSSLGDEFGFSTIVVPTEEIELPTGENVRVSSTMIRYMLTSSRVADARLLLSRPYKLIGKVISGRGKGRQLGFATANMEMPEQIVPAEGVYVGYVQLCDSQQGLCESAENIPAVFSIGQASTFGKDYPLLIEAHILKEGIGDLAGKWMAMDFIDHIRPQHKFPTPQALIEQIKKDIAQAKDILNKDAN